MAVAGPGAASPARPPRADRTPLYCTALFALCLLALFDVLPPLAVAAVALAFLLLCDRPLLRAVDYSLLGTFVAFFIFIGNLAGWKYSAARSQPSSPAARSWRPCWPAR